MAKQELPVQIALDDQSQQDRTALLTIDGRPRARLDRSDLLRWMHALEDTIHELDWMWADYFYASDWRSKHDHLIADTDQGLTAEELQTVKAMCGRQPYISEFTKGWAVRPVVETPRTDICKLCWRAWERAQKATARNSDDFEETVMDLYEAQAVAQRDWHTRVRVRVRENVASQSIDPPGVRHFHEGEEVVMIQWGSRGYPVTRDAWWDSMDIDGAHIIDASKVQVIAVLDEVLPG